MEGDQRADVEVGEDVAVDHEEPLVDAGLEGGEADGAGGVERLGLDGVVQLHAGAAAVGVGVHEGVGPVAERQDGVGRRRSGAELERRPARSSVDRTIGEHLLGGVEGQRAEAGAEAADEDDGPHGVDGAGSLSAAEVGVVAAPASVSDPTVPPVMKDAGHLIKPYTLGFHGAVEA